MGKRGDTEPRENFGGDNGVIILTIVKISRNTYMSEVVIIYFKYVQFTVCQLYLNKAVKKVS